MRIQKREKVLLLILLIVLGSYLFYNFVYLTNLEKLAAKEIQIEQKKAETEKILDALRLEKELNMEMQSLNFEVSNMTESYLASIDQENAIIFFTRYFDEFGFEVNNYSFTDIGLTNIVYDPNPVLPNMPAYPLQ
ncbi:MAG: hypothetical protein CVU93_03380, partial [Firmicutes bacterium HGW-Firmicutes-18]